MISAAATVREDSGGSGCENLEEGRREKPTVETNT